MRNQLVPALLLASLLSVYAKNGSFLVKDEDLPLSSDSLSLHFNSAEATKLKNESDTKVINSKILESTTSQPLINGIPVFSLLNSDKKVLKIRYKNLISITDKKSKRQRNTNSVKRLQEKLLSKQDRIKQRYFLSAQERRMAINFLARTRYFLDKIEREVDFLSYGVRDYASRFISVAKYQLTEAYETAKYNLCSAIGNMPYRKRASNNTQSRRQAIDFDYSYDRYAGRICTRY